LAKLVANGEEEKIFRYLLLPNFNGSKLLLFETPAS
jgi:hypothetical protein